MSRIHQNVIHQIVEDTVFVCTLLGSTPLGMLEDQVNHAVVELIKKRTMYRHVVCESKARVDGSVQVNVKMYDHLEHLKPAAEVEYRSGQQQPIKSGTVNV